MPSIQVYLLEAIIMLITDPILRLAKHLLNATKDSLSILDFTLWKFVCLNLNPKLFLTKVSQELGRTLTTPS